MKIQFWSVGKAHEPYVKEGIENFTKRIGHYFPAEWHLLSTPKNAATLSATDLKIKEAEIILSALKKEDYLILLAEENY